MAEIQADTIKMRECGSDILKLVNEYINLVNGLYTRLNYVPTQTKEWVGIAAENFIGNITRKDKVQLIQLGDNLAKYGSLLVQNADYLEKFANKNRI